MRFTKIALLAAILFLGVASASKQITEAADGQAPGDGQQVLSSQTLAFQCSAMKEEEGWTYTPAYNSYSCSGFDFVGRYAAGGIARVFPDLKSHTSVFVRFYLATFDDWQGQVITFTADGEEVFTKETSPGAERSNQCAGDAGDNIEQLFFQFAHNAGTLDLKINSNLAGTVDTASWGICNLELYFNLCPIDKWYNGKICAETCFKNQTEVPEMRYCETIPSEEEESVEAPAVEEETPEVVVEQEEEVPEVVVIEEVPEVVVEQEEEVPEVVVIEEVPEVVVEQEEEVPEVIVEEEIPEVPVEQEEEAPEVVPEEEETPEVPVEQEEEAPEVVPEEEETPEVVEEAPEVEPVEPVEPVLPVEEETAETVPVVPVTPVTPVPVVPDNGAVIVPGGEPVIIVPNNTVVPTPGTVVVEPCTTSQPQVVVVDAAYNYTYHVPSFKAKAGIVISTGTKNQPQTVVKSPVLSYGLNLHQSNKNLRRQA